MENPTIFISTLNVKILENAEIELFHSKGKNYDLQWSAMLLEA